MQNRHQKKWYTVDISTDGQFILAPFSSNMAWDILSPNAWVHSGPHCVCSLSVNPCSQVLIYRPARGGEQDTQQENSNTKLAVTHIHIMQLYALSVEASKWSLPLPFPLKIQATLYSVKKTSGWGSVLYSQPRNLLFTSTWVKWLERWSDQKTLYNVEITSETMIPSLCVFGIASI